MKQDGLRGLSTLKNMEEQGVNAARNHERHRKIEELTEEKNKELKKNGNFNKVMLGGIAAFALGGFAPIAAAVAAPLMFCGYGTMLYGLYKSAETANNGRTIQNKIERLKDSIAVSNINPRFVTTVDDNDDDLKEENKKEAKTEKKPVKKSKKEQAIDQYIEEMSRQMQEVEERNYKTR